MSLEAHMHELGDLQSSAPSPVRSPTPPRRRALTVGASSRHNAVAGFASPFTEAWLHRRLADAAAHSLPLGELIGFLPQRTSSGADPVSTSSCAASPTRADLDDTAMSMSVSMLSFDGAQVDFQRRARESTAKEFETVTRKVLTVLDRVVVAGTNDVRKQPLDRSCGGERSTSAIAAAATQVPISVFESLDLLEWFCGATALLWASGAGLRAAARSIAALETVARAGIADAARVEASPAAAAASEHIRSLLRGSAAAKASILVRAEMAEYREAYPVPNYVAGFAPTASFSLGSSSLGHAKKSTLAAAATAAAASATTTASAGAGGKSGDGGCSEASGTFVSVDYALNRIYTLTHDRAAMSGRGPKAEVRHFVDALTAFLADFRLACDLYDESIVCITEVEAALQAGRNFLCAL